MLTVRVPAERSSMLLGQAQPQSKRPQSRIVRSAGREPCLCVPSASPPFSREWLTACLQQTPCREIPRRILLYGQCQTRQFIGLYFMVFLFFGVFWAGFFPGQHQTSTASFRDLSRQNRPTPLLPRSLVRSSHIHSKTACRGFKSFCPCQKAGENTGFSPVFFLHVLHGYVVHFGSNSGFFHPVLPVLNRSHPLQHPKRTRFRLFLAVSGCVFLFFAVFLAAKFSCLVFVHPAA